MDATVPTTSLTSIASDQPSAEINGVSRSGPIAASCQGKSHQNDGLASWPEVKLRASWRSSCTNMVSSAFSDEVEVFFTVWVMNAVSTSTVFEPELDELDELDDVLLLLVVVPPYHWPSAMKVEACPSGSQNMLGLAQA